MINMDNSKAVFVEAFKARTKKYTVDHVKFFQKLPKTEECRMIGTQLLRCSSSVGANYRAVCRARSQKEFFAKISIAVEEADESIFWMEVLVESGIVSEEVLAPLIKEGNEILAVLSKARKSVCENNP
jgi:four helix bundle protein